MAGRAAGVKTAGTTAAGFAVDRLGRGPQDDPGRVAVIDRDRPVTFVELDGAADRVANGLRARGVGPGDRVAYVGRNDVACVELLLGAARAGAVTTILNWRLHPDELAFVLADCGALLVLTTPEFTPTLTALPDAVATILVVGGHGSGGWEAWRDAQSPRPASPPTEDDSDEVLQLYTSGTTGRPKGAVLTRRSLAACIPDTAGAWELDASSVMLSVLPLFHIAGAGTVMASLWAGSRLVLHDDPSGAAMVRVIETHQVTNLVLASVVLQDLITAPEAETADLSSVRTVSYGAAPITAAVLQTAIATLDCRLIQAYGLTETAGILCMLGPTDHAYDPAGPRDAVARFEARLRSCGRPRPGVELRIADVATGALLGPGRPGEVQARTDRLMSGYWRRPADTAEVLSADGWFRTGDVGELDADGYLFLRDRLKDTIVSGGENVYPAEVEDALQWHPEVAEVAVIGIPHDRWGETPCAVVVRTAGSIVTGDDLIAFARSRLAHYKCPTRVAFVDALPRNPTGKILRRALREPYWAGHDRRIN